MPCGLMTGMNVPLFNTTLENAWEDLKKKVMQVMISPECINCLHRNICQSCPASIITESGSFKKTPYYLCEMTKEMVRIAEGVINENS